MDKASKDKKLHFSKREAIAFGWETAKANIPFFILIFLVYWGISFVVGYLNGLIDSDVPALTIIINIATWVLSTVMGMGLIKIAIKFVDKEKATYSDLFSSYKLFFNYLIASIMFGIIVAIGFILLIVPGIYFLLKFMFYSYFIVDKGVDPITAFKLSSNATKGVKINLFLFGLLQFLIVIAGLLALVVGLVFAIPTTMVASAYVYRKLASQIAA